MTSQVDTNVSSYNPIGRRPLFNTSLVSPRQVVSWHVKNIIWRLQRHLFKTHLPHLPPPTPSGLVTRHDISVLSIFQRQRQSNCSRRNVSETSLHQEMSARTNTDDCQTFDGEVISSVAVWSRSYCQHLDGRCHISRRTISQKCTPNVRSVWRRRKMYKCLKLYSYINTLWPNLRPPHCDPFTELDLNCRDFYKTARFFCRTFASLQYK